MHTSTPSWAAEQALLRDAIDRDLTTARRAALLNLLWQERYLTRAQLIRRVEQTLGKGCFGQAAWEDNFYRDMRVIKQAFQAAGCQLSYSRRQQHAGYYLKGQPPLTPDLARLIKSSAAEVDPRQLAIYQRLSPAGRFHQGSVLSDTARNVVAYRIRQERPELSPAEAQRLALQRAYTR
jgi:hypothetical protein